MKSAFQLVILIILLILFSEKTSGSGILTINYISFDSKGKDFNGDSCDFAGSCDQIFEICLRYGHNRSNAIFDCASSGIVSPQILSEVYGNEDNVTFGLIIGETVNPVVYITDNQFDGKFEISMVVVDHDVFSTDDSIDHVIMMITATKQTNFSSVLTFKGTRTANVTSTSLSYKFNCDPDYYGSYCDVYCLANNGVSGHYTCDSQTGAKICIMGYFGVDCDIGTLPKPICDVLHVYLDPLTCILNFTLNWQPVSFNLTTIFYLIRDNGSLIHNTTLSNTHFNYTTIYKPLLSLNVTLSAQNIFGESVDTCILQTFPVIPPTPTCSALITDFDPYTCTATHFVQWEEKSPYITAVHFNYNLTYNGTSNYTDSRIIAPSTYYNYTISSIACGSESEHGNCINSVIPEYEFDAAALSLNYSPEQHILSFNWGFTKTPESAPDYVIALNTYSYLILDYKIIGGVWNQIMLETSPEYPNNLLSNQTNVSSPLSIIIGSPVLEALNVFMSLQIIEECGISFKKGTFNLTYNYTIARCNILSTTLDPSNCNISLVLTWDIALSNDTLFYLIKANNSLIHNTTLSNVTFTYTTLFKPSSILNITLTVVSSTRELEFLCYSNTLPGYEIVNDSLQLDIMFNRSSITLDWGTGPLSIQSGNTSVDINYYYEVSYTELICSSIIHRSLSGYFRLNSHLSNYTIVDNLLIYVHLLEISTTLEIVALCGFNISNSNVHKRVQTFDLQNVISPTPTCSALITDFDPYTCTATHLIQWEEESPYITAVYFNYNLTYNGTSNYTDSRIITPSTYYNYTISSIECESQSEHGNCINSVIPGYEFDKDDLSIFYSPKSDNITLFWRFVKFPESAPDHVIALKIKMDIISVVRFMSSDLESEVLFLKREITIFSNQTSYYFLTNFGEKTVDTLNMSLSLQIVEQCSVNLYSNKSTLTYSYNIDVCEGNSDAFSCFKDSDQDGYPDNRIFCNFLDKFCQDNCPTIYNPTQDDCDGNKVGDACDTTCLPETDNIFIYNWTCTIGGHIENTTCIQGNGTASRLCKKDGSWSDLIDTSNCLSPEYETIGKNISIDSLEYIVEIINVTQPANAGDIEVILDVLNTTIEATLKGNDTVRENIVNNTIQVVDFLASDSSQPLLIQSQATAYVAQRLIAVMEQQASILALNQSNTVRLNRTQNVFIETQTTDPTQPDDIVIIAGNIKGEIVGQQPPSVTIPKPKGIDPRKGFSVSVVVIRNIGKLITSFSDAITLGTSGLKLSSFLDHKIVSSVISVQLFSGGKQLVTDNEEAIAHISIPLSINDFDLQNNYIKPTCLSLFNITSTNAQWQDEGIQNVSRYDIDEYYSLICLPRHTTAFVVLVGIRSLENQSIVLNIFSYIGCGLSVICLLISITIYLLFGRNLLKKIYHFVHFNLALSLCLLYLIFLIGVEYAYANIWFYIPCKIVTGIVEYMLLVVFLWMLMEGLIVLIMIMWPFHQFGKMHFLCFTLVSWGIPLIYVVPFIPFYHQYFISPPLSNTTFPSKSEQKYCFIHNDENTNLIYSVLVPLALIIMLNVIILTTVIIRCIMVIVRQKSFSKIQRAQKLSLRLLRLLLVMFPVLGFGWFFGLLAIYFNTAIFAWVFTILCAFQGIFFLFFVLLIRRDIQKSIVSVLDVRTSLLTILSRITSQFSIHVTSKESRSTQKKFPISKMRFTAARDDLSINDELFQTKTSILPPIVELEDLLMFYEERHWPLIDRHMQTEGNEDHEDDPGYFFKNVLQDLDNIVGEFSD